MEKAKEITEKIKVRYLEIRQLDEKYYDLPTKSDFVTMHLKLARNEDFVWNSSLDSKTRNQVRKAYKEKLTVDSGIKYLDDFYTIFSMNMRDFGTPIYPKDIL